MTTALECYLAMAGETDAAARQRTLSQFVDDFRRAPNETRTAMVRDPLDTCDSMTALLAATVETLAVEVGIAPPKWVEGVISPEPYFAFGGRSFALRVRLMLDSPPAFKQRRVFVPDNFLDRA